MMCAYIQGVRPFLVYDLSRSLEKVPILFYEGGGNTNGHTLDTSYRYLRDPRMHPSVTEEALHAVPSRRGLSFFGGS
jgi:hypothetical protein